jgi:hypothetical protein
MVETGRAYREVFTARPDLGRTQSRHSIVLQLTAEFQRSSGKLMTQMKCPSAVVMPRHPLTALTSSVDNANCRTSGCDIKEWRCHYPNNGLIKYVTGLFECYTIFRDSTINTKNMIKFFGTRCVSRRRAGASASPAVALSGSHLTFGVGPHAWLKR